MKHQPFCQKFISIYFLLFFSLCVSGQSIAINKDGSSPNPTSILDIKSSQSGVLNPRLTTDQRNAIRGPVVGLNVFDSDSGTFWFYAGTSWVEVLSGFVAMVSDADADTKIEVEKTVDEDTIRISRSGIEYLKLDGERIETMNTGRSVFLEDEAGVNGSGALSANTTGNFNTSTRSSSLSLNVSGVYNNAFGSQALNRNKSGSNNVAMGNRSRYFNESGSSNVAIGDRALHQSINKSNLVASGDSSLFNNGQGGIESQARHNFSVGSKSMFTNTSGSYNTANGLNALFLNTVGTYNPATGNSVIYENTEGSYNSAFGNSALPGNSTGNNNTAIGNQSLYKNESGSNNVALSNGASFENTDNSGLVAISDSSLFQNGIGYSQINYSKFNTAIGIKALFSNTIGSSNLAIGFESMLFNFEGSLNVALGIRALQLNDLGSNNISIGRESLNRNTNGSQNISIGTNALYSNKTGSRNIAIGYEALFLHDNIAYAYGNLAIGFQSMKKSFVSSANTSVGDYSLTNNIDSTSNSALGLSALNQNTSGNYNVSVDYESVYENTTVSGNTAIGSRANFTGTNFNNSIGIGFLAQPNASDVVRIGNSAVMVIGGDSNRTNVSNGRFKKQVKNIVIVLDFIMKLNPETYHLDMDALAAFNKTPDSLRLFEVEKLKAAELQSGLIAQEVETGAHSVSNDFHGVDKPRNENSHYGFRYSEFVIPLVKAVQEQQEYIETLQKEKEGILPELILLIMELTEVKAMINAQPNSVYQIQLP